MGGRGGRRGEEGGGSRKGEGDKRRGKGREMKERRSMTALGEGGSDVGRAKGKNGEVMMDEKG